MTAAVIEKKRHPRRELANAMHILAMVMESNRDPRAFATRLNGMARRWWIEGKRDGS